MEYQKITFVINGKTYSLRASDNKAIREISGADRQQLIALLESVKQQDILANAAIAKVAARATASSLITGQANKMGDSLEQPKPERLGSGDVDALMARLVMEEKRKQKPGLTREGIYKFSAGAAVLIILLILIL